MTHIEKMKQWLGALEVEDMACRYEKEATPEYIAKVITDLRQAIAEAEGQEKALQALHNENERLGLYKDAYAEPVIDKSAAIRIATALGWEPKRTWVGLTDDEMRERWFAAEPTPDGRSASYNYARAIEAKLKQKNGYIGENT